MNDPNPQFRATGRGYQTRFPNYPATQHTANAWLDNTSLRPGQRFNRMYLFVMGVATGWTVAGNYGQSSTARTFYPQHLGQDDLAIQGITANQDEYDKLVEFIMYHQQRCLGARDDVGSRDVQFWMPEVKVTDRVGHSRVLYPAMHYGGYVQLVEAGHERFRYAVPYTLTMKIGNDFLQDVVDMKAYSDQALKNNFLSVFGSRYKGGKAPAAINLGGNPPDGTSLDPTNVVAGDYWSAPHDTGI